MKTCTVINGNLLHPTGIKCPGDTVQLPDDAAELHRLAGRVALGSLSAEEVEAARRDAASPSTQNANEEQMQRAEAAEPRRRKS